jgi:plastocyanin
MRNGRTGIYAAVAATCVMVGFGVAGASGASRAATEHVLTAPASPTWLPTKNITIQTGDSVRWTFEPGGFHNVQSDGTNWSLPDDNPMTDHPDVTYTFAAEGVYAFHCDAHPGDMDGTVTVQDAPVTPTPDPTTTATATPSVTPTSTPTTQPGGGQPTTPPPTAGTDLVKPKVRSVKLKALRRAVRVSFKLSEPATVTVTVKRRKTVLKAKRIQAGAGTHKVTLRSKKLKKGRYTVEIRARDAYGNRSKLATKRLALRR